jgi:iron complex transport system ATP-binding protein
MSKEALLEVRDLELVRGGRRILKGLNWQVRRGEHWCLLGPNGCGKTSLVQVISGYEPPSDGEVNLGRNRFGHCDWREVRKSVGLVTAALIPYIESGEPVVDVVASGREAMMNLWQPPAASLLREARALLKTRGCGHLLEALWGTLSQGERQKVLVCRAMMARFEVLILDEPCAGLDPVAREQFLEWMAGLARSPKAPSLVMVTHHVEEILPCMTHVALLKEGQMLQQGLRRQVLSSAALSELYGAKVRLSTHQGRHALRLAMAKKNRQAP